MKPNKERSLFEAFPRLFYPRNKLYAPLSYGINCGDGWYEIIYVLSSKLERIITTNFPDVDEDYPKITEIKEKNGELWIDIKPKKFVTQEIKDILEEAFNCSINTCEICGKIGKYQTIYDVCQTLCKEHSLKALTKQC